MKVSRYESKKINLLTGTRNFLILVPVARDLAASSLTILLRKFRKLEFFWVRKADKIALATAVFSSVIFDSGLFTTPS